MAQPKEPDDRSVHIPEHLIETINKLVRTSRQMLTEIGREPTPEELAAKLAMPLEKVRKLLKIAKEPISLDRRRARLDSENGHCAAGARCGRRLAALALIQGPAMAPRGSLLTRR
jgi:hypothetical protein